jgi:hypothetical protein
MAAANPTRLSSELALFEEYKSQWLQKHRGKYAVIKDSELVGFFVDFHDAYRAGVEKFGMNTDFLVKRLADQEPVFVIF